MVNKMTGFEQEKESQENNIEGVSREVAVMENAKKVIEQDTIPTGAACAGRSGAARKTPLTGTVKGKKNSEGTSEYRSGGAGVETRKNRHVKPGVLEAAELLEGEEYRTGRVLTPGSPFDLMASKANRSTLYIMVVRTKSPVANARDVRELYEKEIREIQPYWKSDADDLQFWVFSRVNGLLRYRVFRGGIWRVSNGRDSQKSAL
jgi:hypothetical protein